MTHRLVKFRPFATARSLAALAVAILASGCAGGGSEEAGTFMPGSKYSVQPFPDNYRSDILAFMHTYLNDPRSVRDAAIAPPSLSAVGGRQRYIVCVRYTAAGHGDTYGGSGDRAAVFLDGRMERLIEKGSELCAGASYAPFPEMEKLTR